MQWVVDQTHKNSSVSIKNYGRKNCKKLTSFVIRQTINEQTSLNYDEIRELTKAIDK